MLGEPGTHSRTALANIDVHFADISWTLTPGQFLSSGLGVITTTGFWKQGETATSITTLYKKISSIVLMTNFNFLQLLCDKKCQ